MEERSNVLIETVRRPAVLKIFKGFIKALSVIIIGLSIAYLGFAWYMHTHKKEVLAQVTQMLNSKINGTLSIASMETSLIEDFPRVSVRLNNVVVRDSLYATHKKALVVARHASLTFHSLALLRGAIHIKKITLNSAIVNLYTDVQGYSNTMAIRRTNSAGKKGNSPELDRIELSNVYIILDNRLKGKLHSFTVNQCIAGIKNASSGWQAKADINALVHSLAFNKSKGSFIREQPVKGEITINYNEKDGVARINNSHIRIGSEDFYVKAAFYTKRQYGDFELMLENKSIYWKNAAAFLSPNIASKLNKFSFNKPLNVRCVIKGFLQKRGEPAILVYAQVKNNKLSTPGGTIEKCSFSGRFSNEYIKGKGFTDANSVISINNFKGIYEGMPFNMENLMIMDLKVPVVRGNIKSDFEVRNLQNLIDEDLVEFLKGRGIVNLDFRADIKNFKISKPFVQGSVELKNTTINYGPRNLELRDINALLDFTEDDLTIGMIDLKRGRSRVKMKGSVANFLNLYYSHPEKVLLKWDITSPELYLQDFLSFAGKRNSSVNSGNRLQKRRFTEDLDILFEKSSVNLSIDIKKLYHKSFYASDVNADILLNEQAFVVNNVSLKHSDGSIKAKGQIHQNSKGVYNSLKLTAGVKGVDISKFMASFKNFGMQALTSQNLKGSLWVTANITGKINDAGDIAPGSLDGNVLFTLTGGKLLNFEPLRDIGRFAFPNRDIDNILFSDLNGKFNINGDKVTVYPLKINSSILNMDVAGLYSFGPGTKLHIDVPIRNPKRDEGITNEKELEKRRNRGIVLHLVAEDDKNGKVKIKLGRKRK